jgi:hypothetical protein
MEIDMIVQISNPAPDAHISACGLFCSNCKQFLKKKCGGCQIKPAWEKCEIRKCVIEKEHTHCSECSDFASPHSFKECNKINTLLGKVISFFFRSNRPAALAMIRDEGVEVYLKSRQGTKRM